jgi:hypothetical protein
MNRSGYDDEDGSNLRSAGQLLDPQQREAMLKQEGMDDVRRK